MGGETGPDDPTEEEDEVDRIVWVPVERDDDTTDSGDQRTDDRAGHEDLGADHGRETEDLSPETGDGPPDTSDRPADTGDRPADTGGRAGAAPESPSESETESVDLEALIAQDPADERDGEGDAENEQRDTLDLSPEDDEPEPTGQRGDDEPGSGHQGPGKGSPNEGASDRLWNRYGSDERDTTDDDRRRNTGESGATERQGSASTAPERSSATTAATESGEGGPKEGDDSSGQGTRFDHLLEQSGSGPGNSRPVGSESVETNLDAFFSDLEEFDRGTSGSQVLVISPGGHSITDEVCSQFLTAGGVSGRNAMFVTAVQSPSERVEICRDSDDWDGGEVAVIELGNTGSDSDEALESVGGEEVIRKRVNSPKNLSKTGLLITQTLKKWSDSGQPSVLCFHTLTAISGYIENETLFQFLFTLQAKLNSFGVTGHYHMDAGRHDHQEINTLKTLFDLVITISQSGDIEVE